MKRKGIIIGMIATGAISLFLCSSIRTKSVELLHRNVEALAQSEGGVETQECPGGSTLCAEVTYNGKVYKYYRP